MLQFNNIIFDLKNIFKSGFFFSIIFTLPSKQDNTYKPMFLDWNIYGLQLQELRIGQSETASTEAPKMSAKQCKSGRRKAQNKWG